MRFTDIPERIVAMFVRGAILGLLVFGTACAHQSSNWSPRGPDYSTGGMQQFTAETYSTEGAQSDDGRCWRGGRVCFGFDIPDSQDRIGSRRPTVNPRAY